MNEATAAKRPGPAEKTEELIQSLVSGGRGFHELPSDLTPDELAAIRREALSRLSGVDLEDLGHYSLDAARASSMNCENFIGVAQVPMGVVGPLRVTGADDTFDVHVPLATTEAALVASTNRGCAALREAGGARVHVEDVGMTRAPVFRTTGIEETREFLAWVEEHTDDIRRVAESTSRFLSLVDVRPFIMGSTVLLRFRFTCGDAMGMNMVTIASDRVVEELIEPETGVECVALSGNFCVDKKPSQINFLEGRGKRIFADVLLDRDVLRRVLKTDAARLVEAQYRKNLMGSIAAGARGFNAHFANSIAAFFVATGQDPAHVVEGSLGVTCIEPRGPESVYASVFLPDVPLGAVGGGTELATQRAALDVLGVEVDSDRPGRAVMRLAEILGGLVLASEISLMAAFTSRDLARAHEALGRGSAPREC